MAGSELSCPKFIVVMLLHDNMVTFRFCSSFKLDLILKGVTIFLCYDLSLE